MCVIYRLERAPAPYVDCCAPVPAGSRDVYFTIARIHGEVPSRGGVNGLKSEVNKKKSLIKCKKELYFIAPGTGTSKSRQTHHAVWNVFFIIRYTLTDTHTSRVSLYHIERANTKQNNHNSVSVYSYSFFLRLEVLRQHADDCLHLLMPDHEEERRRAAVGL